MHSENHEGKGDLG
ncbi:unnamed protein product, partial [Vitis vinifera]|uniref:Uncharacterized protein n=1 Tax=Vitis vinifera TaxID=29760 RepID=D7SKC5_VITVI